MFGMALTGPSLTMQLINGVFAQLLQQFLLVNIYRPPDTNINTIISELTDLLDSAAGRYTILRAILTVRVLVVIVSILD